MCCVMKWTKYSLFKVFGQDEVFKRHETVISKCSVASPKPHPATHNTAGKVASQAQKNRFRPKYQNTKK